MGRTAWWDVPVALRDEVGRLLGGPVTGATSQAGGFSPGGADRVVTDTGRRAFVKTIARSGNGDSIDIHRRERAVLGDVPAGVRVPRLVGAVDATYDGVEWVALVIEDVEGVHPGGSGVGADIGAVLDALDTLPEATGPLAALPRIADDLAAAFPAWDRMLAAGLPGSVPPDVAERAADLAAAARSGATALDGAHLVHADTRADNLLVDGDGAVWVVDWPWASVGAHWLDPLTYLLDVLVRGEAADVDAHIARHRVFAGARPDHVDAVLAGLAGMFLEDAARPAPPGLPTVRDFQRREGVAAARWFLRRTDAGGGPAGPAA